MKITAVIAEYNPFHNGHLYQFQTIRSALGASHIIVVMSGDFMQRGIPAVLDKYERCRMALENGADLVFELPSYFALGSAEYFAMGAVSLIDKLGVVDFLHFGSECGDIDTLACYAAMLSEEPPLYKKNLNLALKEGYSFPAARSRALESIQNSNMGTASHILSAPNNILGIEYIKALRQRCSAVVPVTVSRTGSGYHSASLENNTFASANALRGLLNEIVQNPELPVTKLKSFVPDFVYKRIYSITDNCRHQANQKNLSFVFLDDFSDLIRYKLYSVLHTAPDQLPHYYDISTQLAHTFYKKQNHFSTVQDFISACKSKNLTYTRISRCLMHLLLEMRQDNIDELKASDYCLYARLLGFNEHGHSVLKQIKANAAIPVITKLPRALKTLNGIALKSLKTDIYASSVYQSVKCTQNIVPNELTREIIRMF